MTRATNYYDSSEWSDEDVTAINTKLGASTTTATSAAIAAALTSYSTTTQMNTAIGVAVADRLRVAHVTATMAEINAGKELIAGVEGKQVVVVGFTAKSTGDFSAGDGTAVVVQSDATSVAVQTIAKAGLTDGAYFVDDDGTNITRGSMGIALVAGEGVEVVGTGDPLSAGTSITFNLTYLYV